MHRRCGTPPHLHRRIMRRPGGTARGGRGGPRRIRNGDVVGTGVARTFDHHWVHSHGETRRADLPDRRVVLHGYRPDEWAQVHLRGVCEERVGSGSGLVGLGGCRSSGPGEGVRRRLGLRERPERLNVDPDRGRASHTVRVQFAPEGDDFMDLGEPLQTLGSAETRTLTLAAGSYRVVVPASGRYGLAVSRVLVLTDPTVKVKAARSGYGDVLSVDVDPDRGSGGIGPSRSRSRTTAAPGPR